MYDYHQFSDNYKDLSFPFSKPSSRAFPFKLQHLSTSFQCFHPVCISQLNQELRLFLATRAKLNFKILVPIFIFQTSAIWYGFYFHEYMYTTYKSTLIIYIQIKAMSIFYTDCLLADCYCSWKETSLDITSFVSVHEISAFWSVKPRGIGSGSPFRSFTFT